MAKRKVITWPEHKKLLQKRHGAVAAEPTVHGTVRRSKNRSVVCGITAIEMALELRPHPELSKLLRDIITTRGQVDVAGRLDELNLHRFSADPSIDAANTIVGGLLHTDWYVAGAIRREARGFYWIREPLLSLQRLYESLDSRVRSSDRLFSYWNYLYSEILRYTALFVHGAEEPDYIPDRYNYQYEAYQQQKQQELTEWVERVNQRCAQRLAFTRPGSSDIEMQPPPLLEY